MSEIITKEFEVYSQKADIITSSEEYAKRFSGKTGEYLLSVQTGIILDLLKPWSNAKILDVGGGHAQIAVPLVKNGFNVTVAGSDESCRFRLDKFLPKPGSFKFYSCNLLKLPFEDESFDVVICFRHLAHEDNWKLQIYECCRVAKHAVIVDYPDTKSFNIFYNILFQLKRRAEGFTTRTYHCFSSNEVIEEFDQNNFTNSVTIREFFLPMVVHRIIKNVLLLRAIEKLFSIIGLIKFFGSPTILRVKSKKSIKE